MHTCFLYFSRHCRVDCNMCMSEWWLHVVVTVDQCGTASCWCGQIFYVCMTKTPCCSYFLSCNLTAVILVATCNIQDSLKKHILFISFFITIDRNQGRIHWDLDQIQWKKQWVTVFLKLLYFYFYLILCRLTIQQIHSMSLCISSVKDHRLCNSRKCPYLPHRRDFF